MGGSEGDYGKHLFDRDQYEKMSQRLATIKGRFMLSINDVPEIRKTFEGFEFQEADLTYTVAGGKGSAARELIILGPRR